MPWFKIDDGFHGHPKVVELDLAAVGLWTLAGSWCAKYLTDGLIAMKTVRRMGGDEALVAELVSADLWIPAADGYQFNDWADYQPLKETVLDERKAAQERMKKVRAAKKGVRANDSRTDGERSDEQTPKFGRSSEEVRSAPSHPIPAQPPVKDSSSKAELAKTKTFVYPPDFTQWWSVYPRKESKGAALTAFKKAIKTVALEDLVKATQAYALTNLGNDPQFIKLPAGWLNERKWEDEKPVAVASTRSFSCANGHDWSDGPYCLNCGEREADRDF